MLAETAVRSANFMHVQDLFVCTGSILYIQN